MKVDKFVKLTATGLFILFSFLLMWRQADAVDLLTVDEVSVNYKKFEAGSRDPLFLYSPPKDQLDLNVNTSILSVFYMDHRVHSMTNQSQFHIVGLNSKLGVRLSDNLEVGYEHFSRHLLDETYPYQRFPVYDCWTINWYLLRDTRKKGSLF